MNQIKQFLSITPSIQNITSFSQAKSALLEFGTVFSDFDSEPCRLERWPQQGWRPLVDGISGGTTEGSFDLYWRDGVHYAVNSGVTEGAYAFSFRSPDDAISEAVRHHLHYTQPPHGGLEAKSSPIISPHPSDGIDPVPSSFYLSSEINYHACGSQLFISLNNPFLLVLARGNPRPDEVRSADFQAFRIPPGLGVNVSSFVWHAPPIAILPGRTTMRTRQAKVHSKIYYNPFVEHQELIRVDL